MATVSLLPEDCATLEHLITLNGGGSIEIMDEAQAGRLLRLGLIERVPGAYRLTLKGQVEGVRHRMNRTPRFLSWMNRMRRDRPLRLSGDPSY
ncbi:MAG: hypothetical protein AB7U38_07070 [Hyphomicrobiales bacterium]